MTAVVDTIRTDRRDLPPTANLMAARVFSDPPINAAKVRQTEGVN